MQKLQIYITIIALAVFLLAEIIFAHKENKQLYRNKTTIASISIGALYILSNIAARSLLLFIYHWAYQYRLFNMENGWKEWLLLFILNDFSYYWFHRAEHCINWFWISHVVHHSSEHFNMLSALRMPWTGQFSGQFLFWLWLPFLGFNPFIVIFTYNIAMLYQVWLHTESIQKLPRFFEFVFNTPSHHRVHHGCELKYMDKNLGCVFITWDRLFGTFHEEAEKPTYGLADKIDSNNPFIITTQEWRYFFRNVFHAGSVRNSVNYFIQPPGWSHNGKCKTIKQIKKVNKLQAAITRQ